MEGNGEKWGGTREELVGISEYWGGMVGNGVGDWKIGVKLLVNGEVLVGKGLGG
jgi:hypothetical protein